MSATSDPANTPDLDLPFARGVALLRAGRQGADGIARDLVRQLTDAERLGLLDGDQGFWEGVREMGRHGYNHRPIVAGAVPRLGLPGIRFTDGPRGIVMGRSTCFPVAMARGATWDPALEEEIGRAIGAEGRAQGANLFAGVCVNLLRHPAWGRAQETYGEDPVLLGAMGAALARGVRSHLMACVKHFALNSMENARFVVNVEVDDRSLHEVYLPHFREVLDAGAEAVMSAYNSVNGQWCGDSPALLTTVLRDEWKFAGFVMSDFIWGHRDPVGSVAAGLDLEMPFAQQRARHLPAALADGSLARTAVETACVRLVATQLRYAARMESPPPGLDVIAGAPHRRLARRAAAQGMVLLRNESVAGAPLLPLEAGRLRRVALLGRLAVAANLGDKGSSAVRPPSVVTPLDGLRAALPGVAIEHDGGADPRAAAALASACDTAVVVVGFGARDEGEAVVARFDGALRLLPPPLGWAPIAWLAERAAALANRRRTVPGGDRANLALRPADEALVAAVAAAQPRTVVVLVGGSAILAERWRESVPAIVVAWYPGMEGGHALADVLLGIAEPGGRLPFAVPADAAHLPFFDAAARRITYDGWWGQRLLDRDGHPAAWPLGFGLGYTRFDFKGVEIESVDVAARRARFAVEVANTGDRPGATVVQLYAECDLAAAGDRPHRQLIGFRRVSLDAGQGVRGMVDATLRPLCRRDPASRLWSPPSGTCRVVAARHAGDPHGVVTTLRIG